MGEKVLGLNSLYRICGRNFPLVEVYYALELLILSFTIMIVLHLEGYFCPLHIENISCSLAWHIGRKQFFEIAFQNWEDTVQSWHIDGHGHSFLVDFLLQDWLHDIFYVVRILRIHDMKRVDGELSKNFKY